jgi:predicted nucleotidyltransferase
LRTEDRIDQRIPPAIAALLDSLVAELNTALAENLTGVYVSGSIALGKFDTLTSDIDLVVATERPLSDAELGALSALRDRLPPRSTGFPEYEIDLVDCATLRRFQPEQRHVKIAWDEKVDWIPYRPSSVFERATVREHGIPLLGPDPKTMIDPIAPEDLAEAARGELRARWRNWSSGVWPRSHIQTYPGAQGYEVETVCRALFTIRHTQMISKSEAIAWGLTHLPEHWHSLLEWSQTVRKRWEPGYSRTEEVLGFLEWAVNEIDRADDDRMLESR